MILASCLSLLFAVPALAGWQQTETGQWKYEQNGTILAGQWLEDQGSWYYLGSDGIMYANTTQSIAGVDYSFDASGKWIEPQAAAVSVKEGWSLYENTTAGYSIQYPATMTAVTNGASDIDLTSLYNYVGVAHIEVPSYMNPSTVIDFFKATYADTSFLTYHNESEVQLGGYAFTKYYYTHSDGKTKMDLYVRYDSSNAILYAIAAGYVDHSHAGTMEIVNTFRMSR